jgi:E3 ubiquitin-protein ligase RAD18
MEEAVQAFINARPATLELARNANTKKTSSKRKTVEDHHESGDAPDGKRLRSSTRLRNTRSAPSYTVLAEEDETVGVSEDGEDFQPEPGEFSSAKGAYFFPNNRQRTALSRAQFAKVE